MIRTQPPKIVRKSNFKVLFVDDEQKAGKYFAKMLAKDFNIITADNAKEALQIVKKQSDKIAIVVSDQRMPVSSGVELLNQIQDEHPNIVRILTTAYADLEDNIAAINQSHVFGYLSKPWEISKVKEILNKAFEQFEANLNLRSLAGSIAHEVRNPLNAVNLSLSQIKDYVQNTQNRCQMNCIETQVDEMIHVAFNSIKRANELIDITLKDIGRKKIDNSNFVYLNANKIVQKAIREYGYQNTVQKELVKTSAGNKNKDFIFKGDETLLIYIIFNLIKNSLYYENYRQGFNIKITLSESKDHNFVKIRDNGPGIEEEKIGMIFESFVTSGKKGGTGLGLPFCRRVMRSFGGQISCHSVAGEFTEFTLQFPKIGEMEIQNAQLQVQRNSNEDLDKVLDILLLAQSPCAQSTERKIKSYFKNANIKGGRNEQDVVDYFANKKGKNAGVVLLHSNILKSNDQILDQIKRCDKEIPIILLNELGHYNWTSIPDRVDSLLGRVNKNHYEFLVRALCKWNFIKYAPPVEGGLKNLKGKRVLIADDEIINLTILQRILQNNGMEVVAVKNGQELYDEYVKGKFHMIVSDLNMPGLSGTELTRKIRKYELENSAIHTPILSCSGIAEKNEIFDVLKLGVDDYYIKGDDTEYLLKMISLLVAH
jgi:two-component system, CAI-1 autoinducer sensor kinase/phosphatase CqsS